MALRRTQHCHHAFTRYITRLDNQLVGLTALSVVGAAALVGVTAYLSGVDLQMQQDVLWALVIIIIVAALSPLTPVHLIVSGLSPMLTAPRASTCDHQRSGMTERIYRAVNVTLPYSAGTALASLVAIFWLTPAYSMQGYALAAGTVALNLINLFILTQRCLRISTERGLV